MIDNSPFIDKNKLLSRLYHLQDFLNEYHKDLSASISRRSENAKIENYTRDVLLAHNDSIIEVFRRIVRKVKQAIENDEIPEIFSDEMNTLTFVYNAYKRYLGEDKERFTQMGAPPEIFEDIEEEYKTHLSWLRAFIFYVTPNE